MTGRYFPWRLYRKFFLLLFVSINLCFVASLIFAILSAGHPNELENVIPELFAFSVVAGLVSAWLAYRFVSPLRQVILKALRIASKKKAPQDALDMDDNLLEAEPGEFFELERALDQIQKKLRKRRAQLAQEREESQALMSAMEQAVITISLDEKLAHFNSSFATQFLTRDQIETQADGRSLSITQIFRDPQVLELFRKSLREQIVTRGEASIKSRFDDVERTYALTVSPLREEKNRTVYAVLGLFHDLTEVRQAERIRIEFVENASHELRTPLTSVKGYLETLKEDVEAKRQDQIPYFLGIISKNVDRLTELVSDLLTISSLEHHAPLNLDLVEPAIMTGEVIERLSVLAMEKKILIKTFVNCSALKGDPAKLEQVLTNLIDNAIKYVQAGGTIEVHWEQVANRALIRVKDNGPGISEEHIGRLFERFYRVDKGRSRDVGGTGLGLAIVKHIMQAHGGSVSVKSKLGQGAEFICELPVRA